ncbi:MAG: gst [Labilithrix sp.]|nr:gst [Labilithrix sp.]
MAITFYCGSGSPFAWKVWLALEHKKLAYDLKVLSFDAGDVKKPEFLVINPRGKVPALVDDGVSLYESSAILEYLEEKYPEPSILPGGAAARALARRIAAESDTYLVAALRTLFVQTLGKRNGDGDPDAIAAAKKLVAAELAVFEVYAEREFLAGNAISVADFAAYPQIALLKRVAEKQPANAAPIPARLTAWSQRIEALPYFGRTVPPHWKTA